MNSNYTTDDLVRFLYREMEPKQAVALQQELVKNELLQKEFLKLKETHTLLSKEKHDPNDTSVNMVMDYSASYYSAPEHHTE